MGFVENVSQLKMKQITSIVWSQLCFVLDLLYAWKPTHCVLEILLVLYIYAIFWFTYWYWMMGPSKTNQFAFVGWFQRGDEVFYFVLDGPKGLPGRNNRTEVVFTSKGSQRHSRWAKLQLECIQGGCALCKQMIRKIKWMLSWTKANIRFAV